MPNVQVDVLPQIGHAPMLEVPELTAKMFDEFWTSLDTQGMASN